MNTKHPNADILNAIAEGKAVQWNYKIRNNENGWIDYVANACASPLYEITTIEWRIKPVDKVYYHQMLKSDGKPTIGSLKGYDIERILKTLTSPHMIYSDAFKPNGLLAITHTDDGTIAKIEYFTMKELRDKGWL